MKNVLKQKVGFKVIVSMDDGFDYHCEIKEYQKDKAVLKVIKKEKNNNETDISISLYQSIAKPQKLDQIVQKAIELGVKDIVLFHSDFSNIGEVKVERLERIAKEAAKQTGRARLVNLRVLDSFEQALADAKEKGLFLLVPYENEKEKTFDCIKGELVKNKKIALFIGSEGGFSQEEIDLAEKEKAKIITMGSRVLRCETASVVAISLILYLCGEMKR